VYQDRAEKVYWDRPDVRGIVESFARAVLDDGEVPISGEDAKKNLAIVLAAYIASREKRTLKLEL